MTLSGKVCSWHWVGTIRETLGVIFQYPENCNIEVLGKPLCTVVPALGLASFKPLSSLDSFGSS